MGDSFDAATLLKETLRELSSDVKDLQTNLLTRINELNEKIDLKYGALDTKISVMDVKVKALWWILGLFVSGTVGYIFWSLKNGTT